MAERLDAFISQEIPLQPYIVGRGVLPVRGKAILAGSPKANKSFVGLNILLDLARGRNLFGAEYKSGAPVFPVGQQWRGLYLEQELGRIGLVERLVGKEGRTGLVTGVHTEGLEMYLQTRDTAMRFDTPEGRDFIDQVLAEVKPDVVIADPLSKFNLEDENSAQGMGAIMRVVDHMIEDHNTAFVIVHHISKQDPDPSKQKRGGDRLRGSSALFADVDTLLEVTRLSSEHSAEPVLKLSFELRRGEPLEDIFVRRHRDGTITWLGADFEFGGSASRDQLPRIKGSGKYKDL